MTRIRYAALMVATVLWLMVIAVFTLALGLVKLVGGILFWTVDLFIIAENMR